MIKLLFPELFREEWIFRTDEFPHGMQKSDIITTIINIF